MTVKIIRRIGMALPIAILAFFVLLSSPATSIAKRHVLARAKKSSHSTSHTAYRHHAKRSAKLSRVRLHGRHSHHVQQHPLTASEKQDLITKMHAMASSQVFAEDSVIASEQSLPSEVTPNAQTEIGHTANSQVAPPEIQKELAQEAKEELAEDTDVDASLGQFFKSRPGAIDVPYIDPSTLKAREQDFALYDETNPKLSAQRSDIMAEIIDWLGTRYEFGGEDRTGVDCSAFTRAIFAKAFGVTLPRTAFDQHMLGESVQKTGLHFGDLVFFRTAHYSPVSHVGIYIGEGLFANSCCSRGVSVASLESPYWAKHYIGAKRLFTNSQLAQSVVQQLGQMAANGSLNNTSTNIEEESN
jgi:lipoprotein Spr